MLDRVALSYLSTGFEFFWEKQLDGLCQRPWPICIPRSTWITHGIHISRTRHTKYYEGKTFSFVLRVRFTTLN